MLTSAHDFDFLFRFYFPMCSAGFYHPSQRASGPLFFCPLGITAETTLYRDEFRPSFPPGSKKHSHSDVESTLQNRLFDAAPFGLGHTLDQHLSAVGSGLAHQVVGEFAIVSLKRFDNFFVLEH